ncbi:DUF159-domain-containing protein [Plenodomus tracheiphilus IPT5]|uniref:DUF159-domain-containing protein n=1 Tax=Plenodomus tracheiphilus IPT5 TaxID=1408161 RepID=A0A6A7ANX2_9PLEO|nr:DUF159-domain-containing protein [Plenodomus tracheiphilus IPT5]
MCGRYALALRPSEVRHQLEASQMPVQEAPDDNAVRQSYNFAPGYHGLVYRADGAEFGGAAHQDSKDASEADVKREGATGDTKYKLQSMQWGLVPFWTKRNPDYGSKMKTINCRDDSLIEDRGMWTSMKKKKRCIIVAQGFYEWLKKNNGKDKLPHFTKRKDGQLMCFAGLWDCVQFEGKSHILPHATRPGFKHRLQDAAECDEASVPRFFNSRPTCSLVLCPTLGRTDSPLDSSEKLFTYTIITTDSNKQLNFLHDRMPVILENGSEAIRTWLDPGRTEWSKDLQSLLQPFEGELDIYPVSKDVGKVGNNSPSFLVPINSAANKNNIANFFGSQQKAARTKPDEDAIIKTEHDVEDSKTDQGDIKIQHDINETRATTDRVEGTEDKAPMPVPSISESQTGNEPTSIKRERSDEDGHGSTAAAEPQAKRSKPAASASPIRSPAKKASTPAKKQGTRSATSNGSAAKTPKADGSMKITSFFSNK